MRPPNESLDDFRLSAERKAAEAPATVKLRFSGETEVVKPLARWEGVIPGKSRGVVPLYPAFNRLSWFHRSLAVGGAFAIFALIVGSSVYIGIYGLPAGPVSETDVAVVEEQPDIDLVPSDDPTAFEFSTDETSPTVSDEVEPAASPLIRRAAKRRVFRSAYKPRRNPLPMPQFIVSEFVPTTLIIYAENGAIRSRIEPNLSPFYKKYRRFPTT